MCVCVCLCVHAFVSIVASFYVVECPKGDNGASSGFIGNATLPPLGIVVRGGWSWCVEVWCVGVWVLGLFSVEV